MGFAIAFGASGACVFPFAVGAIAQAKGFGVLMPVVLGMLVLDGLVWTCLPLKAKEANGMNGFGRRDGGSRRGRRKVREGQVREMEEESAELPLSLSVGLEIGGISSIK